MKSYITFLAFSFVCFLILIERIHSKNIDDINEEVSTRRLIAGIPYGSISGRLAEYFATERTTIKSIRQDHYMKEDINLQNII